VDGFLSVVMTWNSCFLILIVRRCPLTEKPLIRVLLLLPGYPAIPSWIPPTLKGLESVVSLGADDPGVATAKQLDDRIWLLWNQDANFLLFRPNRKIGKTIIPGAACIVETDEETRPISMSDRQFAFWHTRFAFPEVFTDMEILDSQFEEINIL
jgi:hypothetical protein